MAGTFEVFQDKGGQYRFRLKAGNGEIVLTSQGYSDKAGAMNGVESVKTNAGDTSLFEIKQTEGGKFLFNLKAKNHLVIGTSQMYESESGRDNGIGAVGRAATGASIIDLTAQA